MSTTATLSHGAGCGIGRPSSAASRFSTASSAMRSRAEWCRRADVRRDDQVRGVEERVAGRRRLGVGDVERRAGDRALVQRREQRRLVDDRAAGGVDRIALGRIRASAAASIRCACVSASAGSAARRSPTRSSSSLKRCRSPRSCRTVMLKALGAPGDRPADAAEARRSPASRRARRSRGTRPAPTSASRRPALDAAASGSRRAAASSSANARSAVASVSTSGVLPTGIPRARAAVRSMLS